MTTQEKEEIISLVLNEIKSESQAIDNLPVADGLDGVNSLPAIQGQKLVSIPIEELAKPAVVASVKAEKAAESANNAAKAATDAAEFVNTSAGKPNGLATLDGRAKLPLQQLPEGVAILPFDRQFESNDGSPGIEQWLTDERNEGLVVYIQDEAKFFVNNGVELIEAKEYHDASGKPSEYAVFLCRYPAGYWVLRNKVLRHLVSGDELAELKTGAVFELAVTVEGESVSAAINAASGFMAAVRSNSKIKFLVSENGKTAHTVYADETDIYKKNPMQANSTFTASGRYTAASGKVYTLKVSTDDGTRMFTCTLTPEANAKELSDAIDNQGKRIDGLEREAVENTAAIAEQSADARKSADVMYSEMAGILEACLPAEGTLPKSLIDKAQANGQLLVQGSGFDYRETENEPYKQTERFAITRPLDIDTKDMLTHEDIKTGKIKKIYSFPPLKNMASRHTITPEGPDKGSLFGGAPATMTVERGAISFHPSCTSLASLFKASNITDETLNNVLDGSGTNLTNVTDTTLMFAFMSNVTTVHLAERDVSNLTTMEQMFAWSKKIKSIDLTGWSTPNLTNMSKAFAGTAITTLDLSMFNVSKVSDMSGLLLGCRNLTSVNTKGWVTASLKDFSHGVSASGFVELDLSNFDTQVLQNLERAFADMQNLTTLNLSGWTTPMLRTMSCIFLNTPKLGTLDLPFNTSSVYDMNQAFCACGVKSLDLSNFDTANVTNMLAMFAAMPNITELDISNFDTLLVKGDGFCSMFGGCPNLHTVNLGHLMTNAQNNDMTFMFEDCTALVTIKGRMDCSHFTKTTNAFANCYELQNLDAGILEGLKTSISFAQSAKLTHQSALNVINSVGSLNGGKATLTLNAALQSVLTPEDIASATTKGWTIAFGS